MFGHIASSDPQRRSKVRLAKVSGTFLPAEYNLIRLIETVENCHPTWSTNTPACEWNGIACDKKGSLEKIFWFDDNLYGVLNWRYLPLGLRHLNVAENLLCGDVLFDCLPVALVSLYLSANRFSGTPCLSHLHELRTVDLSQNEFVGWVDFNAIPSSVSLLYLSGNLGLKGTLNLELFGEDLIYDISETQIETTF